MDYFHQLKLKTTAKYKWQDKKRRSMKVEKAFEIFNSFYPANTFCTQLRKRRCTVKGDKLRK